MARAAAATAVVWLLVVGVAAAVIKGGTYYGSFGQNAGNMQFTVAPGPTEKNFRASRMRVVCAGRIYHFSFGANFKRPIHHRVFRFRAFTAGGGHIKVGGIFRGYAKAYGYVRVKGTLRTSSGYRSGCNSGRVGWGARA